MNKYIFKSIPFLFLMVSGCGKAIVPTTAPTALQIDNSTSAIASIQLPQLEASSSGPACKKIAFMLYVEQASHIFSICPDGSQFIQLTDSTANDRSPAWSPDGSLIAFSSDRAGSSQIFTMRADGSNPTQLTFDLVNDYPIWLPDGAQVAFRTTDGNGLWWWRILDIASGQITEYSSPLYDFFSQKPSWSPDGQFVAVMSLEEQKQRNDGSRQIHVKMVDGSSDIALTNDIWNNYNPIWSPDSRQIAFLSERDGVYNQFALYVIYVDGSGVRRLTEPEYWDTNRYSWSPDGTQIAIDGIHPDDGIRLIDVETGQSTVLPIPAEGAQAFFPAWQP